MAVSKNEKNNNSHNKTKTKSNIVPLLNAFGRALGLDGYSNPAAFLGEDSPLISSGTFVPSNLTNNIRYLTTMYRESWLAMRIIDMPSEDMTRSWYKLSTNIDENDINDFKRIEAKHNIKQELTNAIRWARLFGGSIAIMILRDDTDLSQPLDLDTLLPDCFRGVLVLDRSQGVEPSIEIVTDIDDPDFGLNISKYRPACFPGKHYYP